MGFVNLFFSEILRKLFCCLVGSEGLTAVAKLNVLKKYVWSSLPQSKRNQNDKILQVKLVTALKGCGCGIRTCKECPFGEILLLDFPRTRTCFTEGANHRSKDSSNVLFQHLNLDKN